jgi:nucleotide-binding universal stress UspA family protein
MIRKVLLGYDGSESSARALEFAVELAEKFSAELHVVAIARPPEVGDDVETSAVMEQSSRHYGQLLVAARAKIGASLPSCVTQVLIGHPAEQLVRYAEANHVDHIVVGHRGHTVFERWLIGSVARQVVAYATCAVTVVRTPKS